MRSDQSIHRLFKYLRPFYPKLTWSILASTSNKILDLMPPLLVAWVIDTVSGKTPLWMTQISGSNDPWQLALILSILAVIIFALESVFQWAYQYGFLSLAQDVQHQLRLDTYAQLQNRETSFFENHRLGNTLAILNDDVNQLERFINTIFNELIQMGVLVLFAGYVMFSTSVILALFALIPVPIIIAASLFYQSKISPRYQHVREAVGSLNSRLENNIAGISVIKSFTAEGFEYERVEDESKSYLNANLSAIRLSAVYVPLIRMSIAFGFAGVLLMGAYWILNGSNLLSVGQLVLFSMMIQRLLWPLTRLGTVLDEYERARASAKRIFHLLDTPSQIQDPECPVHLNGVQGGINFENISFSYGKAQVLNELSVSIQAGQTVGIAGTTGSGKSTLVKCLMRLYDLNRGSIQIDGINIKQMRLKDLRRNIALVSQDIYLFHGTISENIAYGLDHVNASDIENAAQLAALHDFIMSCPKGYQSIVGEKGIKLSGGQRQRLSIARAILKSSPIMIFDEATSSVDTETERAIQQNINRLTAGKTALVIAHRLSTIRHADRIIVLDQGKIIEDGTHDALIANPGVYADLWNIQIGNVVK